MASIYVNGERYEVGANVSTTVNGIMSVIGGLLEPGAVWHGENGPLQGCLVITPSQTFFVAD